MAISNFKDNVGLTETCILVRRHTKNICEMNEKWEMLLNYCIRDQISFDYLKWEYKIKYNTIDIEDRPIFKFRHGK